MGYTSFSNLPLSAYNELSSKVEDRVYFINDEGTIRLNEVTYGAGGGGADNTDYLTFTAKAANSTVGLMLAGNATAKNVEWSSDEGATWTAFTWTNGYTNVVTLANAGDSIILRCNDGQFSTGDNDWVQFVLTGSIAASGNVMSLLSNDASLDEVPACAFLNLFRDQTALVEAPELPAMKLNYRSYFCMFYGCSLAHAPKLPAEQYASQCYGSMFGGGHQTFTSIEIVGQWDALGNDTLAMQKMFKGCSALNSVTVHWTNWSVIDTTTNWLQNVSATGTFYCPYGLDTSTRDASHIPVGWNVVYTDVPENQLVPNGGTSGQVLTKTADGAEWADAQGGGDSTEGNPDYLNFYLKPNASVKLVKNGNPPEVNLEYSWDKLNWTEYVIGEEVKNEASSWEKCYFRGNNNAFSSSSSNYYNFVFKGGNGYVKGNIMSLLDKSCASKTIPTEYCFYALFRFEQEADIKDFNVMLPAVVLQISCYGDLLNSQTDCVSNFPALPATTLCESCYSGMFYGCNLMRGKIYLPAITPARYCYNRNV